MSRNRSGATVVQSAIDIKTWRERPPTVDEARPAACPCCGAASQPVGSPLQLQGHGTRERQVWGPLGPEEPAGIVEILVRRYRCVACGTVVVVTSREVRARRLYSASAIGLSFSLFGLSQQTPRAVRRRISPAKVIGVTAASGWVTLGRWARAVTQGQLFAALPRMGPGALLRQVAASVAAALGASATPTTRGLPLEHRAFVGAALAA